MPSEPVRPRRGSTDSHGTIHDSTGDACRADSAHITTRNTKLQTITRRKMSPSLPLRPTAAAAIARFCGEIILPSTPPELFEAAIRTSDNPAWFAAVTCSAPNSELADVSDPVTATPSQPRTGDSSANAVPAPAIHVPSV